MHLALMQLPYKTPEMIHAFQLHQPEFSGITFLEPENNPMIRKGFMQASLQSTPFDRPVFLPIKTAAGTQHLIVPAGEKVASIMLGSLAGIETVAYTHEILQAGFDKIFVFGGKSKALYPQLQKLEQGNFAAKRRIISLEKQEDEQIAPIMVRSALVIIRGGGLCAMEQMALPHHPKQTILIHQGETQDGRLSSGLAWEDGNAQALADFLKLRGVHAQRTCVRRFTADYAAIRP